MALIEVTQDHIDRGDPNNAISCPIALAIGRNDIRVCSTFIGDEQYHKIVDLPKAARTFIWRFDSGREVKPTRFRIPGL